MDKLKKYYDNTIEISNYNSMYLLKINKLIRLLTRKENIIWENNCNDIQRNVDQEHLDDLIKYQENYYQKNKIFSFPNPIILCEFNNKLSILDGQHRFVCAKYLYGKYKIKFNIVISIINLKNTEDFDKYFIAVNKNKPVLLYKNIDNWKNIIKKIEQYLIGKWHMYIKNSENPQIPHINLEKFKQYIDERNILVNKNITIDILIEEIDNLNNFYKLHIKNYKKYIPNIENYVNKCISKNKEDPLFLGIYKNYEWLDRIIYKITNEIEYENMEHMPLNYRTKIPKKIREKIWKDIFNDNMVGNCYVCMENIRFTDFECGHVISVFYGGTNGLNNLKPVCKTCNNDMGTMNMEEYKKLFQ